jgi:hypothetical protein
MYYRKSQYRVFLRLSESTGAFKGVCLQDALPMCCQCVANALPMCCQCVANVLLMCCQCVAHVLLVCLQDAFLRSQYQVFTICILKVNAMYLLVFTIVNT